MIPFRENQHAPIKSVTSVTIDYIDYKDVKHEIIVKPSFNMGGEFNIRDNSKIYEGYLYGYQYNINFDMECGGFGLTVDGKERKRSGFKE